MPVGLWFPEVTAGLALSLLPPRTQATARTVILRSGSWILHITEVSPDPFSSPTSLHATSLFPLHIVFPICSLSSIFLAPVYQSSVPI